MTLLIMMLLQFLLWEWLLRYILTQSCRFNNENLIGIFQQNILLEKCGMYFNYYAENVFKKILRKVISWLFYKTDDLYIAYIKNKFLLKSNILQLKYIKYQPVNVTNINSNSANTYSYITKYHNITELPFRELLLIKTSVSWNCSIDEHAYVVTLIKLLHIWQH